MAGSAVKGLLAAAVPALMVVLGLAHDNLGQEQLNGLVDGIVASVQAMLTLVSVAATIYGVCRKIWLTVFA